MNIEQAKAIAIAEILAKVEIYTPAKETETEAVYLSPFRNERTASFHVSKVKNLWYDHGEGIGGNAFDLVLKILSFQGFSAKREDGLRWIANTNLMPGQIRPRDWLKDKQSKWEVVDNRPLRGFVLTRYLRLRGINVEIARNYVSEIYVRHKTNGTKMWAIGFKNEEGGYELRNRYIKSAVSPKTVTFIRADTPKPEGIMVFEGFMDYLSFVTLNKGRLPADVIVLNSVACVDHAVRYIKNYGYSKLYTWFDNNPAGVKAEARLLEFLKYEPNLTHKPMNRYYKTHEDLNARHMNVLGLKPIQ